MEYDEKVFVGGIVGALIVGLLIGLVAYPFVFSKSAPSDHKKVIDKITILDTKTSKYLQPTFLGSRRSKWLSLLPLQFSADETYIQSDWGFYTVDGDYKDLNAMVSIWGPGDDGVTYNVEVARLMGNPAKIWIGSSEFTWSEGTNVGFFSATVTLAGS